MLFNSIDFAIFLPIVFLLYWFITNKNLRLQNTMLVVASYIFYGWWDWRFLLLIFFTSTMDFTISKQLGKTDSVKQRKLLLGTSIIIDLGILAFFKYFNFFVNNFIAAFRFFGHNIQGHSLNIILPVGISFYTFQSLSYTIDVYRRELEPATNLIDFLAFVSFFPQLVAGPIERATNLLPQFYVQREFDYAKSVEGMRQILWGLFKKIVIADNCAVYANQIFGNSSNLSGSTLVLGVLFFTFQIYGDFSGYSDIAVGTARLFGFSLMRNFAYPYFSRDIAEFWDGGISPFLPGSATICIYLLEEAEEENGRAFATPSSSSLSAAFGMVQIGRSSPGVLLMHCTSFRSRWCIRIENILISWLQTAVSHRLEKSGKWGQLSCSPFLPGSSFGPKALVTPFLISVVSSPLLYSPFRSLRDGGEP